MGASGVTYFTPDAYEQVYLRTDLDGDADLSGFVEQALDGFRADTAYGGSELGTYLYTVRAFEHGYLTRVTDGDHGAFVTVDTMTLRSGEEVAQALRGVLS